ncbi:MAG: pyrimidine-nucleoside phosphorylase [Clostridia bacterium]|nr:pyrimidine-nucleoside phosphorylase [Clostridia bacterium]
MHMNELIIKKRNGAELTKEEINFMINGYVDQSIPDYQMSAMLMSIYFQGMTKEETLNLTMEMANSGDILDLSAIQGIKVDKHSTGGVGDKTSLVLGPMVAALSIPVAKMSGRGLGHTGGTIDKLESFKGFNTSITTEQFIKNVNQVKLAIMGQTADLAPADKLLYALRDVTGTVENISLIASSIMSKKLAAGSDAIVLDVKSGSGAFMKNDEDAFCLARAMVDIGNMAGKKTVAIVSDMNQPLGYHVGNALEVKEAIETLSGRGAQDLLELCLSLGTQMVLCAKKAETAEDARAQLMEAVKSGKALNKLAEFVEAQGGDSRPVFDSSLLETAKMQWDVTAEEEGYVTHIECDQIGIASMLLGGGREKKDSVIDLSVGIILKKKIGDYVHKGDTIATLYGTSEHQLNEAKKCLLAAYSYGCTMTPKEQFIKGIVE